MMSVSSNPKVVPSDLMLLASVSKPVALLVITSKRYAIKPTVANTALKIVAFW